MTFKRIIFLLFTAAIAALPAVAQSSSRSGGSNDPTITIELTAKNIAFHAPNIDNWNNILTVPPGVTVIIKFDNQDAGIPHNFAVYQTSAANVMIFRGKIITGPQKIQYKFTAPDKAGVYYFRCDVHPNIMNGKFIVQSSSSTQK